jgi:indoleamine 2,3-dioxygenase
MIPITLAEFDVSPTRGFLPADDPLTMLPNDFHHWEDTVHELPKLLASGNIRKYLRQLPKLSIRSLNDQRSLERAMLLLSYFGHAWIWGERPVVDRIPENIAVPWYEVAGHLNRPPVLSYASHALNNWRRLVLTEDIRLGNICRLVNFLGGLDEEWFVLVHIAIEAEAGPALAAAANLQTRLSCEDLSGVAESLKTISQTLATLRSVLERMPENCDPYIYYNRVRPFIFGWEANPDLPKGVLYEGVKEWNGHGQMFRGETGAQSSIIPAIDGALGIRFRSDDQFAEHLIRLRDYMAPRHRAFIEALEKNETELNCRSFVEAHRHTSPDAVVAYNEAVQEMHAFRSVHLKFATAYIAKQELRASSNPTVTGTGGTPFMEYLRNHVEQTLAHRITTL